MNDSFVSDLCERVRGAAARKERLRIRGGGTKDFYGARVDGETLDMTPYTGIVAYEPKELVLTVRAGTRLAQVEAALAAERQMLPFERRITARRRSAAWSRRGCRGRGVPTRARCATSSSARASSTARARISRSAGA
jgi:hypothetical protein